MTPADLRENVARAIREALRADGSCVRSDICGDASCVCCLEAADAALAVVRDAMREPDAGMLDRGVAFALNVQISGEYGWTPYIRDLWAHVLAASPLRDAP